MYRQVPVPRITVADAARTSVHQFFDGERWQQKEYGYRGKWSGIEAIVSEEQGSIEIDIVLRGNFGTVIPMDSKVFGRFESKGLCNVSDELVEHLRQSEHGADANRTATSVRAVRPGVSVVVIVAISAAIAAAILLL